MINCKEDGVNYNKIYEKYTPEIKEEKRRYLIENMGCDDTTRFEIELNDKEFEIIKRFCVENNKNSSYDCQPSIAMYSKYNREEHEWGVQMKFDYEDDLLAQKEE